MQFVYPFFVAFLLVFISELGDKTQLLVLSFSSKTKSFFILLGVALGSFFSHGIAILFGSSISVFENEFLHMFLIFFTYFSFIILGICSLFVKDTDKNNLNYISIKKNSLFNKISNTQLWYVFFVAFSIAVGEFGDKTFLASLGLGINYPNYKFSLIFGAILGMVTSDSIALVLGKVLNKYISEDIMKKLSGILFLVFGIIGFLKYIV